MHLDPAHAPEAVEQSSDRDHEASQDAGRAERHDRAHWLSRFVLSACSVATYSATPKRASAERSTWLLRRACSATRARNERATQPIDLVGYVGAN